MGVYDVQINIIAAIKDGKSLELFNNIGDQKRFLRTGFITQEILQETFKADCNRSRQTGQRKIRAHGAGHYCI